MNVIKKLIYVFSIITSMLLGCVHTGTIKPKISPHYPVSEEDVELEELVVELSSSNFFNYTRAARTLIDKGAKSIPILYKNRHLKREVDGTLMPVSMAIIRIIFQNSKTEWVRSKVKDAAPEIVEIAKQELERRSNET